MANLTKLNGTDLPKPIVDILHARGSAGAVSAWKVSKRPWMRLKSNSNKAMEIWNGSENWTVEGMHELSGRIVPKPSVTGIKVSSEGTMATMRKVTISFDLFSKAQLIQAQKAFFVPGMSCIASWGWNIQTDGSPITHAPTSFTPKGGMAGATKGMNDWIVENNYSVDGAYGLISDFQWSYSGASNSYGASITITAPARNYLSTGISGNTKGPCGCKKSDGADSDSAENTNGPCAVQNLRDVAKEKIKAGKPWEWKGNFCGAGVTMDTKAPDDAAWYTKFAQSIALIGGDVKYVTWDYFESFVITSCLSPEVDGYTNKTPDEGMQADSAIFAAKAWRMNSQGTELNIPDCEAFFSTDPGVCVLPGYYHWQDEMMAAGSDNDVKDVSAMPTGKVKYLTDIMLNVEFLLKVVEEAETVDECMMKVANKVADVCGGLWDFVLGADPDDSSIIRVINKRAMKPPGAPPTITLLGINSSARDWGMDTDIPADVKHSIMLGSTQQKSQPGSNGDDDQAVWFMYGESITDNMYKELKMPSECVGPEDAKDCDKPKKLGADALEELKKAAGSLADYADEDSVAAARGALRNYLDKVIPSTSEGAGGQTIMPIGFSGTFDGIGGIQWGECFKVKEIDDDIIKYKAFSVKSVSQACSKDDWTTSLETQLLI